MQNFEKLVDATYYICFAGKGIDAIKLNKVLWYSDVLSYMETGKSITGSNYIRKPRGPVNRGLSAAIHYLEEYGNVKVGKGTDDNGYWQDRYDATGGEPRLDDVLPSEKSIIDRVIQRVLMRNSMDISEDTHGDVWELANENEQLPLYTVFAERTGQITEEHKRQATADL